jgi:hypothetical protein
VETLLANVVGKTRRETLNGRKYVVAPLRLIVPGVLNGSRGPLFYPAEEIARDPGAWNGMPIVGYHPIVNGAHVSARDPAILETQGLGYVFRAKADGPLDGEGWFDEALTGNFDSRLADEHKILPRLLGGKLLELSTGLFTDNEPAPEGSVHNGKPYAFVARRHRPDHLAILPDQIGACSNADGCGVGVVNKEFTSDEERKAAFAAMAEENVAGHFGRLVKEGSLRVRTPEGKQFTIRHKTSSAGGHGYAVDDGSKRLTNKDYKLLAPDHVKNWLRRLSVVNAEADEKKSLWKRLGALLGISGATANAGLPSDEANVTPEKACQILKDGTVHGQELTEAQKGLFGAICGKRDKTHNAATTAANTDGDTNVAKLTAEQRKSIIDGLTANCECMDKKKLEGLPDEKLEALKTNADKARQNELVANAVTKPLKAGKREFVFNAESLAFVANGDPDDDDEEDAPIPKKPTGNAADPPAQKKPPTLKEWEEGMPPEARAIWNSAKEVEARERTRLIERLTVNVDDADVRKALVTRLRSKPIDELRDLVALVPAKDEPHTSYAPDYSGAGGGPATNAGKDDSDNVLPVFNADWDEMASPTLRRPKAAQV